MEIILGVVHLLLLLHVMIFSRKESLERGPRFAHRSFLAPFFASIGIVSGGAHSMVGCLKNLFSQKCYLTVDCKLYAFIHSLKIDVD
jgi:hypothetical protein